jgi:hypothetical protein
MNAAGHGLLATRVVGRRPALAAHPSQIVALPSAIVAQPSPFVGHPSPIVGHRSKIVVDPSSFVTHPSLFVMARLDRAVGTHLVLQQTARSSRAMTGCGRSRRGSGLPSRGTSRHTTRHRTAMTDTHFATNPSVTS